MPFVNWSTLYHSKSRHVWCSDPHCIRYSYPNTLLVFLQENEEEEQSSVEQVEKSAVEQSAVEQSTVSQPAVRKSSPRPNGVALSFTNGSEPNRKLIQTDFPSLVQHHPEKSNVVNETLLQTVESVDLNTSPKKSLKIVEHFDRPFEKSCVDNQDSKDLTNSTQTSPTKIFQKGSTIVSQTKSFDTAEEPCDKILATKQGSTGKEDLNNLLENNSDLGQSDIYLLNTKGNVGLFINYLMLLKVSVVTSVIVPLLLPTLFGKRGTFIRSPLLWVFETFSFHCYRVDFP